MKALYSDFINLIILIVVIFVLWRLKMWSNKKYNVPKVFQWFPKKWAKEKCWNNFFNQNWMLKEKEFGLLIMRLIYM